MKMSISPRLTYQDFADLERDEHYGWSFGTGPLDLTLQLDYVLFWSDLRPFRLKPPTSLLVFYEIHHAARERMDTRFRRRSLAMTGYGHSSPVVTRLKNGREGTLLDTGHKCLLRDLSRNLIGRGPFLQRGQPMWFDSSPAAS